MPTLNIPRTRQLLEDFDFTTLFVDELNWGNPVTRKLDTITHDGKPYAYRHIAELAGVVVLEVTGSDGNMPDAKAREVLQRELTKNYHENLLIFLDNPNTQHPTPNTQRPSQSLWRWVKREGNKTYPREHLYVKGQPGDLFISKISGMVFDISRFDELGRVSLVAVADALRNALDVERVTKKFYAEYAAERVAFTSLIQGIPDERKRRWYASVLLNRLMFIYFLQRKMLVNNAQGDYLQKKLAEAASRFGANRYYAEFLKPLFFQGFARPEAERDSVVRSLLGTIPYLNGGLFLEHQIEEEYGDAIDVPDVAFTNLFHLFERYSWNLDDTPEGKPDEINPDVLGYIFEKYINQKEFGAYYTRPEITEYLCEHTIHQRILDVVNSYAVDSPGLKPLRRYETLPDLLLDLNADNCRLLLYNALPNLRLLDPACGSGAFLVAAMKTLVNVYSAVTGRIEYLTDPSLNNWLAETRRDHRSLNYHIKRKIITENLYGVDIMEEAADIARLRLFLALVSSVKQGAVEELEPLPNIDFNILHGNALVGLLHVNADEFNGRLQFTRPYAEVVAEKNRLIATYRGLAEKKAYHANMQSLRDDIQARIAQAGETLDELLLDDFQELKIVFEQAVWDVDKGKEGKPRKRALTLQDMRDLKPFHWGYQFDEVLDRGGFDAIITNPPWEIFKPQAKEFLTEYADGITKNKMTIKEFEAKQTEALKDAHTRAEWEAYLSRFPHVSQFYRGAPQYVNQIAIVNGKKAGTDINLYKLFVEQCYNLLRKGGQCGIIVPSGIYTDLGTKQLREMLFSACTLHSLFGISNEKFIFENVHHSVRYAITVFAKGGCTKEFEAAFRVNPREAVSIEKLRDFLRSKEQHVKVYVELVRRLSPDSISVMEFRSEQDVLIAEKMLQFPLLGERMKEKWNFVLAREFDINMNRSLFYTSSGSGRLPLFTGKMFNQFALTAEHSGYWIDEDAGRKTLLGKEEDHGQKMDYQEYRWVHRRIARNTDTRTMISTITPKNVFTEVNSTTLKVLASGITNAQMLFLCGVANSLVLDWLLRQKVSSTLNMFYIYQLPVPRLTKKDAAFGPIVERAARLICTTPEFDDLARDVALTPLPPSPKKAWERGVLEMAERETLLASTPQLFAPEQPALGDVEEEGETRRQGDKEIGRQGEDASSFILPPSSFPSYGVTNPVERAQLRAELDGLVAHLYGLTEVEFAHILSTFPLVADPVKVAAQNAYRNVARGILK